MHSESNHRCELWESKFTEKYRKLVCLAALAKLLVETVTNMKQISAKENQP